MKLRKNKKGFTIIELVIVVAVISILAAILIPTFISLTNKAQEAADDSLVKNLNTALATQEVIPGDPKNDNFHEAIIDLDNYGYKLTNLITKSSETLLWNSKTNRFLLEKNIAQESNASRKYEFWKINNSIDDSGYSIYAGNGFNESAPVSLTKGQGFDVGYKSINEISYTRAYNNDTDGTDSHNVVIRTSGGELTINAHKDIVNHYGFAESIHVEKIKNDSYHEFGTTYQIDVSTGRVVLENQSKVWSLHLNAKEDLTGYSPITVSVAQGAQLPDFISRDSITTEEDTLMVTIEQLNSSGQIIPENTEEVWITAAGNIADREDVKNENVESELGQKFLESTGDTNEASKEETIQDAKEASIQVDESTYELSSKDDLLLFRDLVNGGRNFAGCTVNLKADIDLENMDWDPIGYVTDYDHDTSYNYSKNVEDGSGGLTLTDSKSFSGIFNGNGHTIKNFKPVQIAGRRGSGLFGLVYGYQLNQDLFGTQSSKDLLLSNSMIQQSKIAESKYSCVIKNINVENVTIGSEDSTDYYAGAVVGVAYGANINQCNSLNVKVYGATLVGGIAGTAGAAVIQYCTTGTDTVSGSIESIQNAGGIVGSLENYYFVKKHSHSVIYNCVNYADVTVSSTNAGGIVGLAQGSGDCAIINCTNNGKVSITRNSASGSLSVYSASGIVGNGASTSLFYHCTNNGEIKGPSSLNIEQPRYDKGIQLSGITSYMASGYFYNCVNNGDISGYANYMGGIVSATHDTNTTLTLVNCGNTGSVVNSFATGKASNICSNGPAIISIEGQIDKLSFVQDYLDQLTTSVDLSQITVLDKEEGNLVIPSDVSTIVLNNNVCDSITINNSSASKLTITSPNVDVIINGNISSTNVVVEDAKSVTVTSTGAAKELSINNVSSVTNNGTLEGLQFVGNNITVNVINNNTIAKNGRYAVSFYSGAKAVVGNNVTVNFMNYGTVSSTQYTLSVHNGNNNVLKFHCANGSVLRTGTGTGFVGLIRTDPDYSAGNTGTEALNISYDNESCKQFGIYLNDKNGLSSSKLIVDSEFDFDTNY